MSPFEMFLALVLGVLLLANLVAWVWLWMRDDRMAERLTRLEVMVQRAPTHEEVNQLNLRLAGIGGQMTTCVQLMKSIQEFLLEREK